MTASKLSAHPLLITDTTALTTLCTRWSQQSVIALDTEFERSRTFYPKLALIQLAESIEQPHQYLLDALNLPSISVLAALLESTNITKVFHACQEDLEVFSVVNIATKNIFDTQVAAAYAGMGMQLSYQALIKKILNIEITKSETRTNWLQRPLTTTQCIYAAEDVQYLLPCYEALSDQLRQLGRLEWVLEENKMLSQNKKEPSPEAYYLSLHQAWYFNPQQSMVLKVLCAWRENYIRSHDVPRSFVFKNNEALAIAEKMPQAPKELEGILGHQHRGLKYTEILLALIQQAVKSIQQGEVASSVIRPVVTQKQFKSLFSILKNQIMQIAQQLGLPESLVLSQRLLEKLVNLLVIHDRETINDQLPEVFNGWRYKIVIVPLMVIFYRWQAENAGSL